MRYIVVIGLLVIVMGCAKKEDINYLKVQELPLAQPRIETSNTIIDSTITLSADLQMEGATIFYTNNGNDPTEQSKQYKTTLQIAEEGTYSFKAFHPDWKPSKVASVTLYKKGHSPSQVNWNTQPNDKYPGVGEYTLINNQKASLHFMDQQWVGFDTIAKASVKFEKMTYIESMTIGYLVDTKSWIFPPTEVMLCLNKTDTLKVDVPQVASEHQSLEGIKINLGKDIQQVEVFVKNNTALPDWHPGKGLKAWLFMDEWIFN